MFSQVYYIIRSRVDGKYLAAIPDPDGSDRYLLLFKEDFDALSYLNKYASDLKDRLQVESIPSSQLSPILQRWGYSGIGLVGDPLLPRIEFMKRDA